LRTGRPRPWRLTHYPRLAWYLARHARSYDVIHVHHANLQADVAVAVGRTLRRPVILKLVGGGPSSEIARWRWLRRWTGHAAFRRASVLLAQGPDTVAELRAVGVRPERIVEIPNGVAPSAVDPADRAARGVARRELGLPDGATVVLWLGRFAGEKGIDDLLRAWEPLRDDHRLALLLVGRPAGRRPVHPVSGANVHVRSWRADPSVALRAADVFVLPSHGEGMSNAVLEALAAGLPVVITPVGPLPARVVEHGAGAVVPVGDVEALRAAILTLATDPERRRVAGLGARAAIADLTIERVVDRIEAVYERVQRPR
jgi:glycosyltransferase involved in cell wall biosynthesis